MWLSLIHGANGIAYFVDTWQPSFREDGIFADTGDGVGRDGPRRSRSSRSRRSSTAPTIPNLVTATGSDASAPVDIMVKAHGTSIYVFAAVSRAGTASGSFTIQGMTGSGSAQVVGENRTVAITNGAFTDDFVAERRAHLPGRFRDHPLQLTAARGGSAGRPASALAARRYSDAETPSIA